MSLRLVFSSLVLALAVVGCALHKHDDPTKAKPKATPPKKPPMADLSGDVSFQSFLGRLRIAVHKRDRPMLESLMAPDFGWRFDKPPEGELPFEYWDKANAWPELEKLLGEHFAPSENFMVSPPAFVTDPNYRGYRCGLRQLNGSWRFAYFVTGEDLLQ